MQKCEHSTLVAYWHTLLDAENTDQACVALKQLTGSGFVDSVTIQISGQSNFLTYVGITAAHGPFNRICQLTARMCTLI